MSLLVCGWGAQGIEIWGLATKVATDKLQQLS